MRKILSSIRNIFLNRILTGLIVIIPLGITFYVIQFIYYLLVIRLVPLTSKVFYQVPPLLVPIASLLVIVISIFLLGFLANALVGRKIISLFENLLERIPIIKTIYSATKQIVSIFTKQRVEETSTDKTIEGSAIFVDFPHVGVKSVAIVTNKVTINGLGEFVSVFVPTTPNPTSGYFQLIPKHLCLEDIDLPFNEVVTMLLSGGFVSPEKLSVKDTSNKGTNEIEQEKQAE